MLGNSVRWAFNWKEWNPCDREFTLATSCIQSEEKERLQKFVFRKDVRASLIGRLLMRKFVSEYTDIPYNQIVFDRDENNRPVLRNSVSCINFNVSHQGDYTVLAGELENIKLGIDLMKLEYTGSKPLSEYFRLMNRVFTISEWREINGTTLTTDREKIAMFYRHWALKESYVKALGVGLAFDLQSMDFITHSKLVENSLVTDTELYIDSVKQNWLFEESLLDSDHCVAVALQEHDGVIPESKNTQFEKLSFTDLVKHAIPLLSEDSEYTKLYFSKYEEP